MIGTTQFHHNNIYFGNIWWRWTSKLIFLKNLNHTHTHVIQINIEFHTLLWEHIHRRPHKVQHRGKNWNEKNRMHSSLMIIFSSYGTTNLIIIINIINKSQVCLCVDGVYMNWSDIWAQRYLVVVIIIIIIIRLFIINTISKQKQKVLHKNWVSILVTLFLSSMVLFNRLNKRTSGAYFFVFFYHHHHLIIWLSHRLMQMTCVFVHTV